MKICGITVLEDLAIASRLGADAFGFNFFKGSSRFVDVSLVRNITETIRRDVELVGVFVNEDPDTMNRISDLTGLTCVQLSGDEGEEQAMRVERKTIKVIRPKSSDDVERAKDFPTDWILFDSPATGKYGGSGRTFDHEMILSAGIERPFLLAGGLTPANVGEIVRLVRPFGVDVASGVESAPGRKDPVKLREFIYNAREALRYEECSDRKSS